jgi:hypothetical protein
MRISKKDRETIKNKFGGRCAYSGTVLEDDWQVDHVDPLVRCQFTNVARFPNAHNLENMVPCQRTINNYKGATPLGAFRNWLLGDLHKRLKKLPKNPITEKSKKHKENLLRIADLFGITPEKPFDRVFYFEKHDRQILDNDR